MKLASTTLYTLRGETGDFVTGINWRSKELCVILELLQKSEHVFSNSRISEKVGEVISLRENF